MLKSITLEDLESNSSNINIFNLKLLRLDNLITIENPYNSNTLYFINFDYHVIIISDSFFEFDDFKIDINGVDESILDHFNSNSVFFKNYHTLAHGFKIVFDLNNGSYIKSRINNNLLISKNPVKCLHNTLRYIEKDNIAVSFSGGLDSTILLYSLKDLYPDKNIVAFNWYNKGTSNNDLFESRKICKKLNIKLIEIEISPEILFTDLDINKHFIPPYPSTYISYLGFIEKYISILDDYFNEQPFTIVNGHGGDQIFYEDIPLEIFSLKNIIKYKSKIKDYIELYSLNYFSFFKSIANRKFNFKEYKEKLINDTLYQTSTTFIKLPQHINFFYPFTSEEMITCMGDVDIFYTFNNKYSRYNIRKSFSIHYNSNDFYRINKGHMTGAYQYALKTHEDKILKSIKTGRLQELKIVDLDLLIEKFKLTSIGVNGFDPVLFYVINFENILNAIKDV
ncbi:MULTISPECIES: adenine nucleotide alpha hydrolase family protein [Acinetobacter]|uniref:Asparagine synthetase domain-containing protein n=1 Tax=Acinetobacter indicus TaxID=756892 RepID=A0A6C0Y6A9_9GAMM|nr:MULTISPECIES: 7-cyano-7-deazaguanine synthase [Acinetobacter]QIC71754.1 hypothetical protein FSC09_15290 [Acinetobacter indicus]QKQ71662.1 hypothetical protein E5Y90_15650 [Acinetobacter sp. 10FS3-1]